MAAILWGEPESDGLDPPNILASPRPTPANRFWEFTPDVDIAGPRATAIGDASQHTFVFRTDYTGTFVLRHLPDSAQATMLALKLWLINGGAVTVRTDDADDAEYDGLTLKPETTPTIALEDDIRRHWRFACELRDANPITLDYSA